MIFPLLIGLAMFLWVPMFAQTENSKKPNASNCEVKNDSALIASLFKVCKTRIVFKDGSIKKNCKIKEVKEYWLVYEKEGSLHDQTIDKIARIELNDGTMRAIFFDEKLKPSLGMYVY